MKRYTLAVTSPEYWSEIHNALIVDSNQDGIPDRQVTCSDCKEHSPTRGTYELTEEEAAEIRTHPHVKWIELSPADNPDSYPKPVVNAKRFKKNVRFYRDISDYISNSWYLDGGSLPSEGGLSDAKNLHRSNWGVGLPAVRKNSEFFDPTLPATGGIVSYYYAPAFVKSDVSFAVTGKNVDIVIHDTGVLQYHPEFLDANGQSRVRDIVLDGPYFIDPDYFNTNNLTYTKADGRVGIATTSAHDWWENGSKRSSEFVNIGTVSVNNTYYTEERSMGATLSGISSMYSGHGTSAASLAAGKYFGNAFEANIWNMPAISDAVGMGVESSYDAIKIFHKYKKVNPETGKKNPTIVNGSWGYVGGYVDNGITPRKFEYRFAGITSTVQGENDAWESEQWDLVNAGTLTGAGITGLMLGLQSLGGGSGNWGSSSKSYSTDAAAAEMMSEGVLYVAAAGNFNQRLGIGSDDPHRLDYFSSNEFTSGYTVGDPNAGDHRTEIFPSGTMPLGHRDWMHPQGNGFDESKDFHPTICVGGIYSRNTWNGGLRKLSASNNGPGIDVWAPSGSILAAGGSVNQVGISQTSGGQRQDDSRFWDHEFGGTSSAAPVVTGIIALYLETNPDADARSVKNWINDNGTILGVTTQFYYNSNNWPGDDFYSPYGPGSPFGDKTHIRYWIETYNLREAVPRIIYNPYARDESPSIENVEIEGIDFSY